MATIVLGAVGRAFAGPVGGLVGSLAGGFLDRALFGSGRRDVGRIDSPEVQSAAYGEAVPIVVGRMRAAGNLIWSSDISEQVSRSGGGKSGQATNQYSYSASFAVGLAARPIIGVGRIWADGRLVRDENGVFLLPMTMRLHHGGQDQAVDPLIAAAEGAGQTPAYRGLAYVVFEDLPLGDFGNRIPNLSFEIIADEGPVDLGRAIAGLVETSRVELAGVPVQVSGLFPPVSGYYFGRSGSVADALAPILEVCDATVDVGADGLHLAGAAPEAVGLVMALAEEDAQARASTQAAGRDRQAYAGDNGPDSVELGYYDEERDYQAGLQRARRGSGHRHDQKVLPAAMRPSQAKGLATSLLLREQASRLKRTARLSWRYLSVRPGMKVSIDGAAGLWRVRELRFEGFLITLSLERIARDVTVDRPGDSGRLLRTERHPAGPTQLQLIELPGLGSGLPSSPVLMVAGAGASPGWRRGGFEVSYDLGASYGVGGVFEVATTMGRVLTPLAEGPSGVWDRHSQLEVELLAPQMWLEGRGEAAVLEGANMALVGSELVQFRDVEAIAPGRFRLRHLLRGRRGTEHAISGHVVDEPFILLEGAGPVPLETSVESLGRTVMARPLGPFDIGAVPEQLVVQGSALKPLAPAHLRMSRVESDIVIGWTRRSRSGYAWLDFVDAPLAEVTESYRLRLRLDGNLVRELVLTEPGFLYVGTDLEADGGGAILNVEVAQMSALVGPGRAAFASLELL